MSRPLEGSTEQSVHVDIQATITSRVNDLASGPGPVSPTEALTQVNWLRPGRALAVPLAPVTSSPLNSPGADKPGLEEDAPNSASQLLVASEGTGMGQLALSPSGDVPAGDLEVDDEDCYSDYHATPCDNIGTLPFDGLLQSSALEPAHLISTKNSRPEQQQQTEEEEQHVQQQHHTWQQQKHNQQQQQQHHDQQQRQLEQHRQREQQHRHCHHRLAEQQQRSPVFRHQPQQRQQQQQRKQQQMYQQQRQLHQRPEHKKQQDQQQQNRKQQQQQHQQVKLSQQQLQKQQQQLKKKKQRIQSQEEAEEQQRAEQQQNHQHKEQPQDQQKQLQSFQSKVQQLLVTAASLGLWPNPTPVASQAGSLPGEQVTGMALGVPGSSPLDGLLLSFCLNQLHQSLVAGTQAVEAQARGPLLVPAMPLGRAETALALGQDSSADLWKRQNICHECGQVKKGEPLLGDMGAELESDPEDTSARDEVPSGLSPRDAALQEMESNDPAQQSDGEATESSDGRDSESADQGRQLEGRMEGCNEQEEGGYSGRRTRKEWTREMVETYNALRQAEPKVSAIQIAARLNLSIRTVYRMDSKCYDVDTGAFTPAVYTPIKRKGHAGCARKLLPDVVKHVSELLTEDSTLTVRKLLEAVTRKMGEGVRVTKNTISQALKELNYRRNPRSKKFVRLPATKV